MEAAILDVDESDDSAIDNSPEDRQTLAALPRPVGLQSTGRHNKTRLADRLAIDFHFRQADKENLLVRPSRKETKT